MHIRKHLTLSATPAKATPNNSDQIRISGAAQIVEYPAWFASPGYARTELRIPVSVRCPAGQTVGIPYAGLPAFFPPPDSRTLPYLPGHTAPTRVECTGTWVSSYAYALSRDRWPHPDYPLPRFIPGSRLLANVAIWGSGLTATDSKTVRVEINPVCGVATGCRAFSP